MTAGADRDIEIQHDNLISVQLSVVYSSQIRRELRNFISHKSRSFYSEDKNALREYALEINIASRLLLELIESNSMTHLGRDELRLFKSIDKMYVNAILDKIDESGNIISAVDPVRADISYKNVFSVLEN